MGGGLAADEARFDFRLLGPSETHGQDMQGKGLPLPGGARRQTRGIHEGKDASQRYL